MIFKKPELEDKKEFLNYVIEAFSNDEPEIPLSYDGHFEKWIEEVVPSYLKPYTFASLFF